MFVTVLSSALSIVWDREFAFMREMLVAPVHRGSIVLGKCAGGATAATLQGFVILALAGVVDVPYSAGLLLTLVGEMVLVAVSLTALGLLLASRMQQVESFMAVMNFVMLPRFFLSGAIFPPKGLPGWLSVVTKFDPLTYAVDPVRPPCSPTSTPPPRSSTRSAPASGGETGRCRPGSSSA